MTRIMAMLAAGVVGNAVIFAGSGSLPAQAMAAPKIGSASGSSDARGAVVPLPSNHRVGGGSRVEALAPGEVTYIERQTPLVEDIAFAPNHLTRGRSVSVEVSVTVSSVGGIASFPILRVADCPAAGFYDASAVTRQSRRELGQGVVEEVWTGRIDFPATVSSESRRVLVEALGQAGSKIYEWSSCGLLPIKEAQGTVPSPPSRVTAVAGDSSAWVGWDASDSDGGADVARYIVTASPGGMTCSAASGQGPGACYVLGLSSGVTYTFTVAATNIFGTSAQSAPSNAVEPTRSMWSPIEVTAEAGNGVAQVSWQPPVLPPGYPVSAYDVQALPGQPGDRLSCLTSGLTCTVTGLTNGTKYVFIVRAFVRGWEQWSDPSTPVTPMAPITTPGAVSSLKAASVKSAVKVTWSPPANMGGATSVTYQYQVGKQAWKSTTATSVTVRGKKSVRITLSVRAVNEAGPGSSISVSGVPR